MNGRCIYKVDGGNGLYRVCEYTTDCGYIMFKVLKGRRLALPVSIFEGAKRAIEAANKAAYEDCKGENKLIYTL